MLFTIIIFIIVLAILVLAHEIGHYLTALKFGCKVEEFGIGFPPRIKKWKSKKSGIDYSLNWIPLGGFVKIKGEDGESREDPDSFGSKPVWQRAIILSAGVLMNIVLAVILLSIGFGFGLPTALPDDLSKLGQAKVREAQTQIYLVSENSAAARAGIQIGDVILSIDGQEFDDLVEIQNYLASQENQEVNLLISRAGSETEVLVTPEYWEEIKQAGIGVGLVRTGLVSYPWYLSLFKGLEATWTLLVTILVAFYTIIKNLIIGLPTGVEVAGPVGIAVLTGQVARMGFVYILQFTALLSINLAIINFIPFPALDGGRVLFLIIEKIRRRPVNQKIENLVHNMGFLLLMALIIFITYRDVIKWGGGLWQRIIG